MRVGERFRDESSWAARSARRVESGACIHERAQRTFVERAAEWGRSRTGLEEADEYRPFASRRGVVDVAVLGKLRSGGETAMNEGRTVLLATLGEGIPEKQSGKGTQDGVNEVARPRSGVSW